MRERSLIFITATISEGFFVGANKVNCAAPFSKHMLDSCVKSSTEFNIGGGRRIAYGTNDGVYVSDLKEPNREPVKVLALLDVTQIDVLEEYQLLVALSGSFHAF